MAGLDQGVQLEHLSTGIDGHDVDERPGECDPSEDVHVEGKERVLDGLVGL